MVAKNIAKLLLRRYMHYVPYQLRWARFEGLRRIHWVKGIAEEIKPEFEEAFPKEAADAGEDVAADDAVSVFSTPSCIQPPPPHYSQYRCSDGTPLHCSYLANASGSRCDRCDFLNWLPVHSKLIGKQGQYSIEQRLYSRGTARQYSALKLDTDAPVTIREYLLPERYFNLEEQKQHQETFTRVAGLTLADGRKQDLRIVVPIEAIVDHSGQRCYLVTPAIDSSFTLNQYCASTGPLGDQLVSRMLDQVLQTLTCLHQQKFAIPTGQTQTGIIHGNLNLDSLLWVRPNQGNRFANGPVNDPTNSQISGRSGIQEDGFVYLTDFALWETLFDPTSVAETAQKEYQQDLTALGKIAFYLLAGATQDHDGKPLNPRVDSNWPRDISLPLQTFVLRLIGIEAPFVSAEAARSNLFRLPQSVAVNQYDHRADELLPTKTNWVKKALPYAVIAATLMLGTATWFLLRSKRPSYAGTPIPPCCLNEIAAVPQGDYTHVSPEGAYWYPLFRNTPASARPSLSTTPTLFDQLKEIYPDLSFNAVPAPSVAEAITTIQTGKADFAIVPLTEPLPASVTSTIIAYDTLVPVVAFSYPERVKGLPDSLKGEISVSELKDIYTGAINHWQQISNAKSPIKRYWPEDTTTLDFFHRRVFEEGENVIAGYPAYLRTEQGSFVDSRVQPEAATSITMMRSILRDFENANTGSIGIAPLSQVVGQCSVYPLALSVDGRATSPLMFDDGSAVKPKSDLCDRKGSYQPNAEAIRSGDYALSYPIAVIYPFDNTRADIGKKLAGLLLTQESQQTLVSAGLVSAYLLPD